MKLTTIAVSVITLLMLTVSPVTASDTDSLGTGWNLSLIAGLTATQAAYSDSWTGGEAGSFSWVGNLNGTAEKALSPKMRYRSILKLSYGQSMVQDKDTKEWEKPFKSTDLIDWENLLLFTLDGAVDPYVAFRLESQFVDASVSAKNRYLNPLKLTESAGVARQLLKNENSSILTRFGAALRQTITRDFIDEDFNTKTNTATDGGLESVTDVNLKLDEKLTYIGKLTLYKALFFSQKDDFVGTPFEDDWKAVDVNWENTVSASITELVSVSLYTQFLYDKQVSRKGRLKQTLGLGISYSLI